jgi:galactose mutarotase-like enzyme
MLSFMTLLQRILIFLGKSSVGFPGDLDVYVTYRISGPYELTVHMNGTARNKATPVNLAQHSYWNLGGHSSGTILSHMIQIFASESTPVDENLIPTGSFQKVTGTPYDFREPASVGSRIDQISGGLVILSVIIFDALRLTGAPVLLISTRRGFQKVQMFVPVTIQVKRKNFICTAYRSWFW